MWDSTLIRNIPNSYVINVALYDTDYTIGIRLRFSSCPINVGYVSSRNKIGIKI